MVTLPDQTRKPEQRSRTWKSDLRNDPSLFHCFTYQLGHPDEIKLTLPHCMLHQRFHNDIERLVPWEIRKIPENAISFVTVSFRDLNRN